MSKPTPAHNTMDNAIAFLQECRNTHEEWIAWLQEYPDYPNQQHIGDRPHHVQVIQGYNAVIETIERLQPAERAASECERLGYDGQKAVEALPNLLRILVEINRGGWMLPRRTTGVVCRVLRGLQIPHTRRGRGGQHKESVTRWSSPGGPSSPMPLMGKIGREPRKGRRGGDERRRR